MSYTDLLERMMQRDTDAFLEMTDRYGWALYSEIRKKYPQKAEADKIYDETMKAFYRSLQNPTCEDPMEALLCGFADSLSGRNGASLPSVEAGTLTEDLQPPRVELPASERTAGRKAPKRKGGLWFRLGMVLVLIGFVAVIWIGLGLMMEAGMIPYYDLGYSWFSVFAARWI